MIDLEIGIFDGSISFWQIGSGSVLLPIRSRVSEKEDKTYRFFSYCGGNSRGICPNNPVRKSLRICRATRSLSP